MAIDTMPVAPPVRLPTESRLRSWPLLAAALSATTLFAVGARLPSPVGTRVTATELAFVALFVESLPFLLIGAILSAGLRGRSGRRLLRAAGRRPLVAAVLAPVAGVGLPICDCGLLPLAREMRAAGGGRAVASFLAGAPLTNPVVILTTLLAFPLSPTVAVGRVVAGLAVAMVAGFFVPPASATSVAPGHGDDTCSTAPPRSRLIAALGWEIGNTAPTLVLGALLAATIKEFVPTDVLTALTSHPLLGAAAMMTLAFVMSICSQADAFVAASLPIGSLPRLAFLVLGPVLDLRLAVLYRREFGTSWLIGYASVVLPATFAAVTVLATIGLA